MEMQYKNQTIRKLGLLTVGGAVTCVALACALPLLAAPKQQSKLSRETTVKVGAIKSDVSVRTLRPIVYSPKPNQWSPFPLEVRGKAPKSTIVLVSLFSRSSTNPNDNKTDRLQARQAPDGTWAVAFQKNSPHYSLGPNITHSIQVIEIPGNYKRTIPIELANFRRRPNRPR
jgi:hypothetical protein